MTGLTARSLLNVVYAWLTQRADAADQVAVPVMLAAGVKPKEVEKMSLRDSLDDWLYTADSPAEAAGHAALLKELGVA